MRNETDLINVAVIGGNHHNTLGVIRSLGEQGVERNNIHVLLIGDNIEDRNIVSVSKYVLMQNVEHAVSYDAIVDWLLRLSEDGIKRVVICCSDGASETVISNSNKFLDKYYLPSSKIDISELMEKNVQDTLASSCGLHTPKSAVISHGEHIEWNCYPCISKPLKSMIGAGKQDICIVESQNELDTVLGKIKADKIQIQEFLSKRLEFQLIGCSLDSGKKIIIPGYTKIIRQPRNTNTGYLEYSPIEELDFDLTAVYDFIKKIGYSGLFSVEFIRDKNNVDYFLEINMRNDGNAYCVKSAGINLPFIWCYYMVNNHLPDLPLSFKKSIRFIPDFNDLKVALSKGQFFSWIVDFCKADSHSIYNKTDLKPFWIEICNQVKKHL